MLKFKKYTMIILVHTGNIYAKVIGNMQSLNMLKRWIKTFG
jgi:hypothetical protein